MNSTKLLQALEIYVDRMTDDIVSMVFDGNNVGQEEFQECLEELEDRLGPGDPPDQIFFYNPASVGDGVEEDIEDVLGDPNFKDICISVAVFYEQDVFSVSADNVAIDGSTGIHLNVFLTPEYEHMSVKSALNDEKLFDEIGNSIRHEIEHLIQDDYPQALNYLDYHKIYCPIRRDPSSFFLYLVQPSEVSAHVRGYEHVSRTRDDFFKSIRVLLNGYKQNGLLTEDESLSVLMCWEDWFLRNTHLSPSIASGEENV